jgi:2'-hydroxyisoflavone reductase
MRILVLGGTGFIGRHLVATLVHGGHSVATLARGKSKVDLGASATQLHGDRDLGATGLNELQRDTWDACVDLSGYTPRQVRGVAEILFNRVSHYIFVSAMSVYGDPANRPVLETHPKLPPASEHVTDVNAETYGPLKVACEQLLEHQFKGKLTLLRPQIVVRPHDARDRLAYWLKRAQGSGPILAPGDGSDHLQFIDVQDVAEFIRKIIEDEQTGTFNLAGPRLTWRQFMGILGATDVVWVGSELLKSEGVTESDLPLFRSEHGPRSGLMDISNDHALRAGLRLTDTQTTVDKVSAWVESRAVTTGLSREREAQIIEMARKHLRKRNRAPGRS